MGEEENENGIGGVTMVQTDWKKQLKTSIESLKNMPTKDRLDVCASLGYMFFILSQSTHGWLKWLQLPIVMQEFSEEELREYNDIVKRNVIELLELDLKVTDAYYTATKKVEKKFGEINKTTQKNIV